MTFTASRLATKAAKKFSSMLERSVEVGVSSAKFMRAAPALFTSTSICRITSYNVCYTKLLRGRRHLFARDPHGQLGADLHLVSESLERLAVSAQRQDLQLSRLSAGVGAQHAGDPAVDAQEPRPIDRHA